MKPPNHRSSTASAACRPETGQFLTRFATSADISVLHALVERSYRGVAAREGWTHEADLIRGSRTDVTTLAATIADKAQRVLLYEDRGTLLASVTISDHGDGTAYMGMLAVEPKRQGDGIGRAMLAAADRAAIAEFGARRIEMTVIALRTELVAYYERCGYVQTGERRPFPVDVGPDRDSLEMAVLGRVLLENFSGIGSPAIPAVVTRPQADS